MRRLILFLLVLTASVFCAGIPAFALVPVAPTATATNDCDQVTISINDGTLGDPLAASAENYSLDVGNAYNTWTSNQIGQKIAVPSSAIGTIQCKDTFDYAMTTSTATTATARLICRAEAATTTRPVRLRPSDAANENISTLTTTATATTTNSPTNNGFTVLKRPL